jgi:hypothetical protein
MQTNSPANPRRKHEANCSEVKHRGQQYARSGISRLTEHNATKADEGQCPRSLASTSSSRPVTWLTLQLHESFIKSPGPNRGPFSGSRANAPQARANAT